MNIGYLFVALVCGRGNKDNHGNISNSNHNKIDCSSDKTNCSCNTGNQRNHNGSFAFPQNPFSSNLMNPNLNFKNPFNFSSNRGNVRREEPCQNEPARKESHELRGNNPHNTSSSHQKTVSVDKACHDNTCFDQTCDDTESIACLDEINKDNACLDLISAEDNCEKGDVTAFLESDTFLPLMSASEPILPSVITQGRQSRKKEELFTPYDKKNHRNKQENLLPATEICSLETITAETELVASGSVKTKNKVEKPLLTTKADQTRLLQQKGTPAKRPVNSAKKNSKKRRDQLPSQSDDRPFLRTFQ